MIINNSSHLNDDIAIILYGSSSVSIQLGLLGGILIISGLQLIAFGFRCYRLTLSIANSIIFGGITWIGLINNKPAGGYSQDHIIMFVVPLIIGIVGGVLCYYFCKNSTYSNFIISVLGGISLALYICSWRPDLVIPLRVGRIVFISGLPLLFILLTIYFERHMIFFCTSFCGGFLFILGVDLLTRTGYIIFYWCLLTTYSITTLQPFNITRLMYAMLVLTTLVTLISYLWQVVFNLRQPYFHILSKQNNDNQHQHQHQHHFYRDRISISAQSVSPTPTHYEP
ncbi:unnamed protein product [Cunninghamella echinulata]